MTVIMDSGIRRGTDVLKALALGANFVFVGRPMLYATAIAGPHGVHHAIKLLEGRGRPRYGADGHQLARGDDAGTAEAGARGGLPDRGVAAEPISHGRAPSCDPWLMNLCMSHPGGGRDPVTT